MSESVLVTGKRISDMELLANLSGSEKIPTGAKGDGATTADMIRDYTIDSGNLIDQGKLDQSVGVIGEEVNQLSDQIGELSDKIDGKVDKDGSVKSVVGLKGVITKDQLTEALGLGSSSSYDVEDLPLSTTQLDRFKLEVKVQDFGAVGDAKVDDTQAFEDLEQEFSGRIIDLLGKTYMVTKDFNKNTYINGGFKFGGVEFITTKGVYSQADFQYRKGVGNGKLLLELSADVSVGGTGSTGTSIFQEVVYHPTKNCYYATQEWSGSGADELMVITKYHTGVGGTILPEKQSLPTKAIGHQGLGITIEDGQTWFWSVGGSDIYPTRSRNVAKFQFNEDTLEIENVKHFKVFSDRYVGNNVRVMDVAQNMDTLVTVGSLNSDVALVCRVFQASKLIDENADYSESYLNQFYINKPSGLSMQSCCTDGKFVYVIHSSDSKKQATLDIYTLTGTNVLTESNFTVGIDESNKLTHKYWLPESVFLTADGNLAFHIAIGKRAGGGTQTSFTNLIMGVDGYATKIIKGEGTNPALFLDGTNQFGLKPTQQVKTVEVNSLGEQRLRKNETANFSYLYPNGSIGGYYVIQDTANDARMFVQNTNRRGMLQVSGAGNFGLYDGTNDKWLMFSKPSTPDDLTFTTNLVPSSNGTKTLGIESARFRDTLTNAVTLSGGVRLKSGTGSPQGVQFEAVGSLYVDRNAGDLYIKTTDASLSTGWVLKKDANPLDFGAVGDSTTNDTQAFTNLESMFTGQIVDLKGKVYFVDKDFSGNQYTNGSFRVGSSATVLTKRPLTVAGTKYYANIGNGMKIGELLAEMNEETGSGSSIIQGVDYHPNTDYYYATRRDSGSGADEKMVLVRYKASLGGIAEPLLTSSPTTVIGHQSLAHSRGYGITYFWTIGGADINAEKSRHVTRFRVDSSLNPTDVKHFKVWGDEFTASTVRCMCVTPDYQHLITVNATINNATWFCRVFKVSDLVDDTLDYSDKYITQFTLSKYDTRDLQDCCSDGNFIYFLNGASSTNGYVRSSIEIHDMGGALVYVDSNCAIGRDEATSMPYTYYEPESMFMMANGEIGFSVAIGKKGGQGTNTPHTNVLMTSKQQATLNLKTFSTTPAVHFEGTYAVGVRPTDSLRVAEFDGKGVARTRHELSNAWSALTPVESASNAGFSIRADNSPTEVRYRLNNNIRSGMLQISGSGNFGMYDNTNNRWILNSPLSGSTLNIFTGVTPVSNNLSMGNASNPWSETYSQSLTLKGGVKVSTGSGSPEGVVVGNVGSLYIETTTGEVYRKVSGTGNTGWTTQLNTGEKIDLSDVLLINKIAHWDEKEFKINVLNTLPRRTPQLDNNQVIMSYGSNTAEYSDKSDSTLKLAKTSEIAGSAYFYWRNRSDTSNRSRLDVNIIPVPKGDGSETVNVLVLGDSNLQQAGACVIKKMIERGGYNALMKGTYTGQSVEYRGETLSGRFGEARGGLGVPSLVYKNANRWFAVDDAGALAGDPNVISVADYKALPNADKATYNPMVRKATESDDQTKVYNGYIFDIKDYFTKLAVDVPDVLYFNIGSNELSGTNYEEINQTFLECMEVIFSRIREDYPDMKIVMGHNVPAIMTSRDGEKWEKTTASFFKTKREIAKKYGIHLVNTHVIGTGETNFSMGVSETTDWGVQTGTWYDGIHYQKAVRFEHFDHVSANIIASFKGLV